MRININFSISVNSVLKIAGGTFEFGGEDFLNLSDDADFLGSVLSVSGILGSPSFAFSFLLGLSFGGGIEFSGGIVLSLLLGGELVLDLSQFGLGFLSCDSEGLSLVCELDEHLFEVELGLDFGFSVIDDGLFEGGSEFSNLVVDGLESLGGEG